MKKKIDEKDKQYKYEADKFAEKCAETGGFTKLLPYNNPKVLIFTGSVGAAALGGSMAFLGVGFSEYLSLLVPPIEAWELLGKDKNYFHDTNIYWALILTGLAVVSGVGAFWQQYSFNRLGAGATLKVRELLYEKILQKDIGWFDQRDNAPGVLTNTMAQDTSIINGVSSEGLGPICEASFAMLGGVIIAFIYCWQEALICLVISPFMVVGSAIAMELQKGLTEDSGEKSKHANLLAGDSVINFKTVQSFGYTDKIVEKYRDLLYPVTTFARCTHIKTGIAFGFS